MKNFIFFILGNLFWVTSSFSLEVDEKLPLRILEASDSKKTVLINRGIEDGLVDGDHAKFFLVTGVIARGVLIKASPTRSVWSLYTLSEPSEIEKEKVMNLKITTPVKLTDDPSKSMKMFDFHQTEKEKIVLAEGPTDYDKNFSAEEKKKLEEIQTSLQEGHIYSHLTDKTLEIWTTLHLNAMNSSNSLSKDSKGTSGTERHLNLMLGLEKYFKDENSWFEQISFSPFFHHGYAKSTSLEGHKIGNSTTGGGITVSYHFIHSPLMQGVPLFHLIGSYGMGVARDYKELNNVTNDKPSNLKGTYNAFSFGGGLKYYFGHGLGLRVVLDYYQRAEVYKVAESADPYTKVVKGPRFLVGLSMRW